MLSATGSPLVAGGGVETHMKMQRIRVIRPFNLDGKPTAKNAEIEVPLSFAVELRSANKAEFIEPKPESKPEPAPAKAEAEPKAAKPQKGEK